jgi:hypothetical protein
MPWVNGTFSRTNGANTGPDTWDDDRQDGIKITSGRHDAHDQDVATALNDFGSTDSGKGASLVKFESGSTVQDLASTATATKGSFLVGVFLSATGYVGRTLSAWIADRAYCPKDFGAIGGGAGDDAAAIQLAVNALISAGGGTLNLDDGTAPVYNHSTTIDIGANDNITVNGGAAKMVATADCYTWSVGGQSSFATALTYYDITGSYTVGDRSVTLATPAENTNFAVDDYIYMRCQQEIPGETDQPVAEINKITAIDSGTGVISLLWPMTKDFTDDATYPYGVAVANSLISDNVNFYGGIYENSYRRAFNSQHVINHEISGTKQIGRGAMVTRGRFISVHDNEIELTPDWSAPIWRPYFWAVDTGTSDASFFNNVCRSSGTALIHMHEGLGNVKAFNNDIYLPAVETDGSAELLAAVSITGQSWGTSVTRNKFYNTPDNYTIRAFQNSIYSAGHRDIDISDNDIFGTVTAGSGPGTAIRTDLYCDGKIHGNRVLATVGGNSIQVDNGLVTVRNNEVTAGTAALDSALTEEDVTGNKGIHLSKVYLAASEFDALAGTPALTSFATARGVCWALDAATLESVAITRRVPIQATAAVVKIHVTNLGAGVGYMKWNVNYAGFAPGEDTDVADSTVSVTTTGAITQDYLSVLTLASFSVTGGEFVRLTAERDAADAADTLGNDAGFVGMEITFS